MFQPVVPLVGYAGWKFLERTLPDQQKAFVESNQINRDTDYFLSEISQVSTAEDLVANRRLLSVALGAFGLEDDIDSKFFIQKILQDGTSSSDALANRLSDKRYRSLSNAFSFGDPIGPRTGFSDFGKDIVSRYEKKQFEKAVGQQDNNLRLALNVAEGLAEVTENNAGTNSQWFSIMGNPPLRAVFEAALGLPTSVAQIDVDQQLTIFKNRSRIVFGSERADVTSSGEAQEKLIRLFLIRSQAANVSGHSGASTALTLLQNLPRLF